MRDQLLVTCYTLLTFANRRALRNFHFYCCYNYYVCVCVCVHVQMYVRDVCVYMRCVHFNNILPHSWS